MSPRRRLASKARWSCVSAAYRSTIDRSCLTAACPGGSDRSGAVSGVLVLRGGEVTGSFVMGLLVGWLAFRAGEGWTRQAQLFVATGVLGGYTTALKMLAEKQSVGVLRIAPRSIEALGEVVTESDKAYLQFKTAQRSP